MCYRYIIPLIFVFSVFFTTTSHSKENKLTISVGQWPPYITQELKHNGPIAHMLKDIFMDNGYILEFTFYPWERAYWQAALGDKDLTGIWMHKPDRETYFHYSDPILSEKFVFFHRKDFKFDWTSIKDLGNFSILGMFGNMRISPVLSLRA